jgi:hypothetical protein
MEDDMRSRAGVFSILFPPVLGLLLTLPAVGGEVLQSVTTFVHGEILNIDGPYYTVKDQSGREVRLHIDGSTTRTEDTFGVGDRIAADVTPHGHVGLIIKEGGRQ